MERHGTATSLDRLEQRKGQAELPEAIDPCGENGEFHTFDWNGPMFARPVALTVGETVERQGFIFTDVIPADLVAR